MEFGVSSNEQEREPFLQKQESTFVDIPADEVFFSVGVQAERIRCRRNTLKSTSPVFGSILTDAINNGRYDDVIELPDVQPGHFRNFLKVSQMGQSIPHKLMIPDICAIPGVNCKFYCREKYVEGNEHFTRDSFTLEEVAEVFKIAKKYSVSCLQKKCREFLHSVRTVENVVTIYECAQCLDEPELETDLLTFITKNFAEVARSADFSNLSYLNLCRFLKMDEIVVPEVDLFLSTYRWGEAECKRQSLDINPSNIRNVLQSALFLIRYPLMSLSEFSAHVLPKEILKYEEIDAITTLFLTETDNRNVNSAGLQIVPFITKRRGLAPPKTYRVGFYECLVYNSEPWVGDWNYNIIKVNRPVSIVGFEFDGPVRGDAVYFVKMKLVEVSGENSENFNQVAIKEDIVHAKKQRTFFLAFDNPVPLKPDVVYKAHYALSGPKTIWGVQPRSQVRLFCDQIGTVVFTFQCIDGQVPFMRFTIPSNTCIG